ncbi:MAG: T9SS type A sorting domain-containing protein [Crocinitomicaceae bacterium]|nr:T9SS type A sorting domain-containing protein [Crocinitomicaceae bacterium]
MSCENTPDDAVVVAVDNCSPSVNVSLSAETIPNQCGYTFIRTWTATDDCGNVATASQVIEAFDAESPVFTFVPEDVVIGCGENIDVTPAIAEDACSSVTIDYFDSMPSDCSGSFTRTFTATDGCGNSSVASQQITIVDSIPPVVVSFPDNITVDCLNIPDIDDVVIEFSDACSEVTVSFTQNIISGECDGEYQILYSYLAEDNCGNHINPVWVINVVDNEAPVFAESPEDTFIECGDELPIANTPAAIDNCTSVSVSLSESVQETECGFITTRTWTATDACGNSSQISQNITSEDTTPPYFIEFPENVTVECNEIPGNESSEVTYSDNCSAVSVQFSETTVSGDCPNGYSILRTWTLTDDCGNSQSMTWTITVQDTEAPTLLGVPQDITINCGDPISDALVFATDNCSDFIEVSLSAQTIQLECGYLFIRTWAGNDDCGNHTEASQTITVLDNQPPVFDFVPESILITCGNQPEINDATASDACSNVTVTYTDTPVEGDCIGSFIRNYTATDGCGNSATASVTVNIMDNVPPQFLTFPQDLTVDCSDVPGVESADVTYIDNCGTVSVEIDEVTIPGECPNSYTLQRTWTLTDDCGNSSYGTWTIQVEDHIAPVLFGVPEDTSLFCGESPSDAIVFAVDNCSTGLIVSLTGQTVENDCGFTFLRTWSTTDECGNVGSLSQTIGVIDLIPPVFNFVPSDTIIFCDAAIDITQATATDLCSDVTVTFSDILTGDCAGSFIRTYTATDACGNNASVNQNVTIIDNTAPSFIGVPNDLIIECGDELPAPVTPEVTDNCSEVSVSLSESTQDTECGFITVRTWTATDACGNSSQISQSIISADTTPPFFLNFPNDIAAECDNIPGNESTDVTFGDNCGDVSVQFSETTISGNCPNSYQILRTWILTDDCGNSQSGTWTISVQDTEAPVLIGVPQDVTINCGDPITDALVFATDNCSPFVEVSLSAQTIQQECGYLFIRTWTGTDDCGNSAQSSQTITVIDNQPPVFTFVPETVSVTCGNEFGVADATAIDACSNVTVTFADTPLESGCLGSFLRTFTATDGCGNSATASVIVNFIDNTPPQFLSFPSDVNVDCSEVPDAESSGVTYTDNCSSVFVQISETTIPGNCPNSYTLLRTWTLTDECGNTASATWTIQSQDVTDPVLFNVPADTTINCSDVPAEVVVTATDNCSVELEVSYTSVETDHTECGYTIERTWRAEDECGNSEMAIQLVHVIDDAPPVFTFVPSDVVINCGDAILSQPAMATDECSSVSISFEDQFLDDCAGSFVRVFTATDACGNSTTAQQNVTLFDFTPPTIINFPPDITVNCQNVPSIEDGGAQFTDNCSELSITVSESTVPGECSSEYTVIYSYHVEDACGNGIDPVWTIHVTDTDAPVFNEVPAPILGECGSENSVIPPVATDLCSEVTVTYTDTETELDCGLQIVRVWTATDACGNSTSVNQTITLEDTTGPEFTTFPEDLYYSCSDGEPPLVLPSALDACAGEVPVYYTDLISAGECPGETVIQRVFRAFDDCGNDVLNVQMIYIEDTEGPVFDENTSYISVSCNDYSGILTSATDACSDFSIEYSDEVFEGGCGGSVQRTYIATDLCGNQTVFEQFIELTDDTSPQFDAFPAEVTAECSNIPPSNTSLIQYSDNCSSVELTVSEEIIDGSCINTYTLLRTYTLTDACGNETSQVWTINVSDTTPPVLFGVPADATVDCGDVIPDALVFAQDNCSGSTAVGLSASTEETDCGYIFTRIWTSTDDCGNTSQATQIITAIDQSAPVLEGTPEDLVLECGSVLPEVASVTATDNCAGVLNVDYVETPVGDNCGSVQRTWCATDCAEQVTCYTQNITFVTMLNPSLDIFYQNANEVAIKLTVDNNMPSLLDLYSISGKEIQRLLNTSLKKGEYYSYSIPTSELAAGVYVVRLYTGGKTLTQRFVVSR